MKEFLNRKNEVVNYYRIGEILWKDEFDKFSLWAISRLIFRIRYKLQKLGFNPNLLENVRGEGYRLRMA